MKCGPNFVPRLPWVSKFFPEPRAREGKVFAPEIGGGVVLHGLADFGVHQPFDWIESTSAAARRFMPAVAGTLGWATQASLSGVFGLLLGVTLVPLVALGARSVSKHRER